MLPSTAKALSAGRDSGLDASPALAAWASVRGSGASFLLVSVTKANALEVVSAPPTGGFDALRAELLGAPDRVLFGAFPFSRGGAARFCFFAWVGPAVSGMARAKVALQKNGVARALEGCSAELQWMEAGDTAREAVAAALSAMPGAGEVALP